MTARRPADSHEDRSPKRRPEARTALTATDRKRLKPLAGIIEPGADRILKRWNAWQRAAGVGGGLGKPSVVTDARRAFLVGLTHACRSGDLEPLVLGAVARLSEVDDAQIHLGQLVGSMAGVAPAISDEAANSRGKPLTRDEERALARLLADITDRVGRAVFAEREKAAVERAMSAREQEERFRAVFRILADSLPLLILRLDGRGRLIYVNQIGRELWALQGDGRNTMQKLTELTHPDDVPILLEALETGMRYKRTRAFEVRFQTPDGEAEPFWAQAAFPPGPSPELVVLIVATPLSERQARESRSHEERRIESLASLTGGIAHEFNNLLNNVMIRAQWLGEQTEDKPRSVALDISDIARRGANLVHRLRLLSATQPARPSAPMPARRAVRRALEMARADLAPGLELELELDLQRELPAITVEPDGLRMAFVELLTNAQEAMGGAGRASVVARTTPGRGGRAPTLCIEVHDEGPGVPAEIAGFIFDPFVTTKPPNLSAGLGLAVVESIVRGNGGEIRLRTRRRGASFEMAFPVCPG